MKKRIILVTQHIYNSKRKAGFHWLADAYAKMGHEVLFLTVPLSFVSYLVDDYRYGLSRSYTSNEIQKVAENTYQYINKTIFHVPSLRNKYLDFISWPLINLFTYMLRKRNIRDYAKEADIFIFESGPALFLFQWFLKLAPNAHFIYRVSDDIELLNPHPALLKLERRIMAKFDRISVPCSYIDKRLRERSLYKIKPTVDFHGINKELLKTNEPTPYQTKDKNCVFVGNTRFDSHFLKKASELYPEFVFHIIGPIQHRLNKKNVIYYGEIRYESTVAYIKYADICLSCLEYSPGAESFTDSLKILQYCYFKKPIIVPSFLRTDRVNTFSYNSCDEQDVKDAFNQALNFNSSNFDMKIEDWLELATNLVKINN